MHANYKTAFAQFRLENSLITGLVLLFFTNCSWANSMTNLLITRPATANWAATTPNIVKLPVSFTQDCRLDYHWEDFRGLQLSNAAGLSLDGSNTLTPPASVRGYLSLVLTTDCPDLAEQAGFVAGKREIGFALLPEKKLPIQRDSSTSPFGMVHADLNDPYLGPWIKTLTWHTTSAKWWHYEIEKRAANGYRELPLINGDIWESDDSKPVTTEQLARITQRANDYFSADTSVTFWELGLEENLTRQYKQPYYWKNLAAKTRAVRDAAKNSSPDIKLIYQIATIDAEKIEPFARSKAARYFDILSIHPYAWPDFPPPDRWLGSLIHSARDLLESNNLGMPIWFTEVGAPHHGNAPGEFFGYPKNRHEVSGLTRYRMAIYIIKLHTIALSSGIERIFWYNYRDRKIGSEYAENFFGLVDYWGHPRPAYVAYARMVSCLDGLRAGGKLSLPGELAGYEFHSEKGKVIVVWNTTNNVADLKLDKLGIQSGEGFLATDIMGNPAGSDKATLSVTAEPIFIATGSAISSCR